MAIGILISLLAFAALTWVASICIYRRYFHPLSQIPGPFLPAVTMFYQSYHHCRYYLQIEKLHQQYGPIVRINPNEVHLSDPENYDRIHHVGTKYTKSANFYDALCAPYSSFGALLNDVHRIRRGAMNPMFSRSKVLDLEFIVQEKARKVCQRMQTGIDQGEPVDLHHGFRALSVDVASEYAFGKCYDFLDAADTGKEFFDMARGIGPALWAFQQFPLLQAMALKIPPWMAPYLSAPLGYVTGLQVECARQIESVKAKLQRGEKVGRQTIFTTLLTDDGDKPRGWQVPTTWQLKDEAYSVLVAAADTTGNAMTTAAFNVLNNENIYRKLTAELEEKFPPGTRALPLLDLETLPYLTAVIKEGLRLSFGVIGRLPRTVPSPGSHFNGYFLPAGTIVGMSSWLMHRDPSIFPDPMTFSPERWLKSEEEFRHLEHYLVPFGKGSRQCVGMPLAYAELYITLGNFFRRFPKGLKVFRTTPETMADYEDYFSSYHPYKTSEQWLRAYMDQTSSHS